MNQRSVTVTEDAFGVLRKLAAAEGRPVEEVLARAIADYRQKNWLARCEEAYAALPKQSSDAAPTRPRAALQTAFKKAFGEAPVRRRRREA